MKKLFVFASVLLFSEVVLAYEYKTHDLYGILGVKEYDAISAGQQLPIEKKLLKTKVDSIERESYAPFQEYFGKWEAIDGPFFRGKVYINKIKTREGSGNKHLLIIYSAERTGLFCAPVKPSYFVCNFCLPIKLYYSENATAYDVTKDGSCSENVNTYFDLEDDVLTIYGQLADSKEDYYVGTFKRIKDEP